jgi:hypothetical protein
MILQEMAEDSCCWTPLDTIFPTCFWCAAYQNLRNVTMLSVLGDRYKSLSSFLCNILNWSLFTDIFLSTLFSDTCSPFHTVKNSLSYHTNQLQNYCFACSNLWHVGGRWDDNRNTVNFVGVHVECSFPLE